MVRIAFSATLGVAVAHTIIGDKFAGLYWIALAISAVAVAVLGK